MSLWFRSAVCMASLIIFEGDALAGGNLVAGTYSDLRYVEEAGDLVGTEIEIIPQPNNRYSAVVQYDEGSLGEAVFVPVTVRGNSVAFSVPAPSDTVGAFTGTITTAGFNGFFMRAGTKVKEAVNLKRKQSYWR